MTHPSTRQPLAAWDHAYLWHPFTQMQEWEQETPLIIEQGKGSYLIDTEGRKYLDGRYFIDVCFESIQFSAQSQAT